MYTIHPENSRHMFSALAASDYLKRLCILTGLTITTLLAPIVLRADDAASLIKNPNLSLGSISVQDTGKGAVLSGINLGNTNSNAILQRMRGLRDDYLQKQKDIALARNEVTPGMITALEVQKARQLEEYRQGLFCSGCGKTQSEILSDPNPERRVFPHKGEHVVPATPEKLAAKAQEWDDKIAQARREQAAALVRLDRLVLQSNQLVQSTERAVLEWKMAMRQEDDARAATYVAKIAGFKKEKDDTQATIRQTTLRLTAEQMQGAKASQELMDAYKRDLDQELKDLANIGVQAGMEFQKGRVLDEAAAQSLSQGMHEANGILGEVGGQMLVPPQSILGNQSIKPSASISLNPSLSLPVSANINANSLKFSADFGLLRASLAYSCDWLRNECKLNVSMAFAVPILDQVSLGMQSKTTHGPDGVVTETSPSAKAGSLNLGDLIKKK